MCLSGGISLDVAKALNSADLAVRANEAMFDRSVRSALNGFLSGPENVLSIVGVHHRVDQGYVDGATLGLQAIDTIEFVRPNDATGDEVPFVMSNVSQPLGLLKPALAFLQVPRQRFPILLCAFALRDVLDRAE